MAEALTSDISLITSPLATLLDVQHLKAESERAMHIQQANFGADIEPVYDKATYVLKHYSYSVMDSAKGNAVIHQGKAKDLKGALAAAEKHIGKLLRERPQKPVGQSVA